MAGFLSKLFGGGKSKVTNEVETVLNDTIESIIKLGNFELDFKITSTKEENDHFNYSVEFSGADEELLKDRKGQMLDSLHLYLKRVIQHSFPDDKSNLSVDCGGYREENEAALIERAEHLKTIAIEQGKSVYYRALPPKERKIVHQYLSQDSRVKSRSLGDGLYKKIKIFPAKSSNKSTNEDQTQENS